MAECPITSTQPAKGALAQALQVIDLGLVPYAEALKRQRELHDQVLAGDRANTLLLLEHPPVITISRRRHAADHLLATPDRLAELGIDVQETDRGGDITYHGPGQLVAYPIVRLSDIQCNISQYMCMLEQVMIDTVGEFGVMAERRAGMTGVWMMGEAPEAPEEANGPESVTRPAKLAALGVRLRKGVTMHGLAMNVATDLSHFQTIVPCGLADRDVTSLSQLLGDNAPTMDQVKRRLVAKFVERSTLTLLLSPVEDVDQSSDATRVSS